MRLEAHRRPLPPPSCCHPPAQAAARMATATAISAAPTRIDLTSTLPPRRQRPARHRDAEQYGGSFERSSAVRTSECGVWLTHGRADDADALGGVPVTPPRCGHHRPRPRRRRSPRPALRSAVLRVSVVDALGTWIVEHRCHSRCSARPWCSRPTAGAAGCRRRRCLRNVPRDDVPSVRAPNRFSSAAAPRRRSRARARPSATLRSTRLSLVVEDDAPSGLVRRAVRPGAGRRVRHVGALVLERGDSASGRTDRVRAIQLPVGVPGAKSADSTRTPKNCVRPMILSAIVFARAGAGDLDAPGALRDRVPGDRVVVRRSKRQADRRLHCHRQCCSRRGCSHRRGVIAARLVAAPSDPVPAMTLSSDPVRPIPWRSPHAAPSSSTTLASIVSRRGCR